MSLHLRRDLDEVMRRLVSMAAAVEEAVVKAISALEEGQIVAAREVIKGEAQIDEDETHIEEECLKILALHQPVAVDLRVIATVLKINTDLERIGDLAEDISLRAIHLADIPRIPTPAKLVRMGDVTTGMVRQSLDAFLNQDANLARRVIRLDDEVDDMNTEVIREMISVMQTQPDRVEAALSLFSACRHVERIADHATNIAEDVVFLVEGKIIRHRSHPIDRNSEPE